MILDNSNPLLFRDLNVIILNIMLMEDIVKGVVLKIYNKYFYKLFSWI